MPVLRNFFGLFYEYVKERQKAAQKPNQEQRGGVDYVRQK
jgi:hypothetical protein